jgi:15-cis-phytoene synthase
MHGLSDRYTHDLKRCEEILRAGSKSFYAASRLLPQRVRGPATIVYAFCRVADDAVDEAPPEGALEAVQALRSRLDRVYESRPDDHPIDRALSDVVAHYGLPRSAPDALLDGFLWDAQGRRYETLSDVLAYSARVASAVGVIMTWLMGPRSPGVLARACDLGAAMQLTNICRDVGDDARIGRIYLPLTWLREAKIDPEAWVQQPRFTPEIAGVVSRLLREAEVLYQRADLGVAMLPRDCRPSIRAARLVYSDMGRVIANNGYDSVTTRAVVSTSRKIALLVRASLAVFTSSRQPSTNDPPVLEEVRFLIEPASTSAMP